MHLHISMTHESEDAKIDSLYRWLSSDPDVVRRVEVVRGSDENRPGAMGPDAATISVMVSAGAAAVSSVAALISAIAAWRNTQPRGSADVTLTSGSGTATVDLSDEERQSPEELSRRIATRAGSQEPA
jgi:hypothetical protein